MKHFDGAILRAVISVLLGIVLILWPAAAVIYIIMLIGAGFLLPGVISIVSYFLRDKSNDTISRMFPLAGLGSVLLGAWLILMPGFFVNILMFVLGGVLLIAGIEQFATLISARKFGPVRAMYYFLPALILLAGLLIIFYPMKVIEDTLVVFGAVILVYGVNELINWYKFKKNNYIQLD